MAENILQPIKLILDKSANAAAFGAGNRIHHQEFDRTISYINEAIELARTSPTMDGLHNAITILGTRGSGKTSFLLSIHEHVKANVSNIQVLNIIDPTLIEEKGHVFLNVISVISVLVEDKLDKSELTPQGHGKYQRKDWRDRLMKLAAGIPSIDGIGHTGMDSWQDPEFVMDNGLTAVKSSMMLKDNFNSLMDAALSILNKEAFLLTFDDIDVDSTKGVAVLECIRKYFTSVRLITILSGDLKLYSTVIRQKKWKNFGKEILKYEGTEHKKTNGSNERLTFFNDMVTELSAQYMLKIMQPQYRIHLTTILEKKNIDKGFYVEVHKDKNNFVNELEDEYASIFKQHGIHNKTQQEVYKTFILGQPVRTQVQFLIAMKDLSLQHRQTFNNKITDIFLADLLEKNVDVILANNTSKYLNAIIIKLLLQEKRLNDLYQLQPAGTDTSLNACLFTLGILFSNYTRNRKLFLTFDYFIKIGYIRNLLNLIPYRGQEKVDADLNIPSIEHLCENAGVFTDYVLRDVIGYIQGYIYGCMEQSGDVKSITHSFTRILALKGPARRPFSDRLDSVFTTNNTNCNSAQATLGQIPAFLGIYNYKNESRLVYSIYTLISAIGEIVKRYETLTVRDKESDTKKIIASAIKELSQLRGYPIVNFSKTVGEGKSSIKDDVIDDEESEIDEEIEYDNDLNSDGSERLLIDAIHRWLISFKEYPSLSPHLLGKMSTRFFYAMNNIEERLPKKIQLGELFHSQVIAFMNAILIEDIRESDDSISRININNTNFDDRIFINNLQYINSNRHRRKLEFSRWLLGCPLLLAYIKSHDEKLKMNLSEYSKEFLDPDYFNFSVHDLLNRVGIVGQEKNYQRIYISKLPKRGPSYLKEPEKLVDVLQQRNIPYEWFQSGNMGETRERNKKIIEALESVFKNDALSSTRIKKFRDYLTAQKIQW